MHVACSGSSATPDAAMVDASTGGLSIQLVAKGGVPQMPTADVEIDKVTIGATSIRAIGDAAPGDMRTTRTQYQFEWRDNLNPIPILFTTAPPGLYSQLDFHVNDSSVSATAVDIIGRARRGGMLVPFEIDNKDSEIPIDIDINTLLGPREIAVTTIELDIASLVENIDWASIPLTTDGRLYITDGDAAMSNVVSKLTSAFSQR